MTHLEIEHLASDYLEGQLDAAARAQMEKHLDACEECRGLMGRLREALDLCHTAEALEPPPWMVPNILRATIGESRPAFSERLQAFLRPVFQLRVAYTVAMAVFSISILINASGLNVRKLRLSDLNPGTWFYRANQAGHLLAARAERFYYDLRVVYEIESRLSQLRPSNARKPASEPARPAGGASDKSVARDSQMAWIGTSKIDRLAASGRKP